jgi:hypothetical protein
MRESQPDVYSLLAVQADLVRLHMELGQAMAKEFGAKESAYINRKIAEANQYVAGRSNPKKKIADVTQESLLAVGEEFDKEIQSAVTYESYRTLLRSLQNALDYSRTVVSFLKQTESLPPAA